MDIISGVNYVFSAYSDGVEYVFPAFRSNGGSIFAPSVHEQACQQLLCELLPHTKKIAVIEENGTTAFSIDVLELDMRSPRVSKVLDEADHFHIGIEVISASPDESPKWMITASFEVTGLSGHYRDYIGTCVTTFPVPRDIITREEYREAVEALRKAAAYEIKEETGDGETVD